MKFLANENFPLDAVEAVRKIGHDLCRSVGPADTVTVATDNVAHLSRFLRSLVGDDHKLSGKRDGSLTPNLTPVPFAMLIGGNGGLSPIRSQLLCR